MTLEELGREYSQTQINLQSRIDSLRSGLETCDQRERESLLRRINNLYILAAECRATGKYLQNYYAEDAPVMLWERPRSLGINAADGTVFRA